MKFRTEAIVEFDVKQVRAHVPFDDDDDPTMPPRFIRGQVLNFTIDFDEGRIVGWPPGEVGSVHIKVVDRGSYWLLDGDGDEVASIDGDYVPNGCIPGSYGDYVEFEVGPDGKVTPWKTPDLDGEGWVLTKKARSDRGVTGSGQ